MIQGRRGALAGVAKGTLGTGIEHAGLWLDKFMPYYQKRGDKAAQELTPQQQLVNETAEAGEPGAYSLLYERWKIQLGKRTLWMNEASVDGRMAVGLGAESVLETSVMIHRTFGVPYIPGSALKGVAAKFASKRLDSGTWGRESAAFKTVFGTIEAMGYITFYDALYVPSSGVNKRPLHPDVLTVHHPEYYRGDENAAPADWDSPTPVPFLSATGRYLIAVEGPDGWVGAAFEILRHALAELGVGAKTSTGYGRLTLTLPAVASTGAGASFAAEQRPPAVTPEALDTPEQLLEKVNGWRRTSAKRDTQLRVLAIKEDGSIELEIPGFTSSRVIGIMKKEYVAKQYQQGNTAKVRVHEIQLIGGRIVLEVRPPPPKA